MDQYKNKSEKISKLASLSPDELATHLADTHSHLANVAPNIAPLVHSIAAKGISFLNSKLPKPNVEFSGQEDYEPSKSQKQQWLNYHDAVDSPIDVLDHVKNGTLNNQHLEALQTVHPELYDHMKQQVMENMSPKAMKYISYSTKIALSKFLAAPQAESLMPQVIMADQANFGTPPAQSSTGAPTRKSTQTGLSKLNLGKRSSTEIQSLEDNND